MAGRGYCNWHSRSRMRGADRNDSRALPEARWARLLRARGAPIQRLIAVSARVVGRHLVAIKQRAAAAGSGLGIYGESQYLAAARLVFYTARATRNSK